MIRTRPRIGTGTLRLVLLVAAFGLSGAPENSLAAGSETAQSTAAARSWEQAEIWIAPRVGPFAGGSFRGRLDNVETRRILGLLPPGERLPTVLFLHGCAFTKHGAWTYARRLALAGYAVVIPNSFANPRRPVICNKWNRVPVPGAPLEAVHRLRLAELAFAASRVRALPWVDPRNLFVMGHEDGADAVAASAGAGFRAAVLSASSCARGWRLGRGLPVLVLVSNRDPVNPAAVPTACTERAGPEARAELKVIPDGLHDLSGHPVARRALLAFLARMRVP